MIIEKKLTGGMRLIYEHLPYLRSCSLGIWIANGSRHETSETEGMSHFIEHMLFKGTTSRSAREIAEQMDDIGGYMNAFTARECTCFYTKTLDSHLEEAMDILSDMVAHPRLNETDIALEKDVVAEEIRMYEDTPEELVQEQLNSCCFPGHSIGKNILGTIDSLASFTADSIRCYMQQHYAACNIVIAIAGNFDPEQLVDLTERYFSDYPYQETFHPTWEMPIYHAGAQSKYKEIEQAHLAFSFPGLPSRHEKMYSLLTASNILGGGMSSRLFQSIREEKGLAYSIYTYPSTYRDAGYTGIYAGCSPLNVEQVEELICRQIELLRRDGVTKKELLRTKEQMKSSFILSEESTYSRMSQIGKQLVIHGNVRDENKLLEEIDQITCDDVNRVIQELFQFDQMGKSYVLPEPQFI
mgnify:CR=1 FL=1